jgi:formylglycine-generating enzyme required for sulfatase activity
MKYQAGDILLGRYRVEGWIGEGAFGQVYRATHLGLKSDVAVKMLRRDTPGLGSSDFCDFQKRFQFEAQLGNHLKHPNLVKVFDFGENQEMLALAMELATGGSLSQRLRHFTRQADLAPWIEVAKIGLDVASGLAELHRHDIVHRDLKPSNILFDRHGRAMISDLGLAQVPGGPSLGSRLSQPVMHPGTPGYMSPEALDSRDLLTPASDIYSLGVVMFESLTGRQYRLLKPGTRLSEIRADLPNWLVAIIDQMLTQDYRDRPWDGEAVGKELQAGLDELRQRENEERRQQALARELAERQAAETCCAQLEELRPRFALALQQNDWGTADGLAAQAAAIDPQVGQEMQRWVANARADQREQTEQAAAARAAELRKQVEADQTAIADENLKQAEHQAAAESRDATEQLVEQARQYLRVSAWTQVDEYLAKLEGLGVEGQEHARDLKLEYDARRSAEPWRKILRQLKQVRGLLFLLSIIAGLIGLSRHLLLPAGLIYIELMIIAGIIAIWLVTRWQSVVPVDKLAIRSTDLPELTATPTTIAWGPMNMQWANIPAGSFLMGSENGDSDEGPVHEVYLDAYYINVYEVTNSEYAVFLNEMGNQSEGGANWLDASSNDVLVEQVGGEWQPKNGYEDHPVVFVSWYGARAYCEWAGGRLPTEAEWEKAARGGLEGKQYPWGDEAPVCTLGTVNGAQYGCGGRMVAVGNFQPNGYGLLDMAGNVWEWTADWYNSGYYAKSPGENPPGPSSGNSRVLRGAVGAVIKTAYVLPTVTGMIRAI